MNRVLLAVSIAAAAAILLAFAVPLIHEHLDEAARLKTIDEFREHAIYKKFKTMYPDSTESFGLYKDPILFVKQSDARGNTLALSISKGAPLYPYLFRVICGTDWAMLEEAFDFLDDHDCLQDS